MSEKLNDEMKKSIEDIVNEVLNRMSSESVKTEVEKIEDPTEDVEKAMPKGSKPDENIPENGGKDDMKSGTPHVKKQEVKKSDCDDEVEEHEEEMHKKKKKLKKSLEELSEILDEDEVELISAWREETSEDVAKSQSGLQDSKDISDLVKSAVGEATADLKKAITDKDDLIKSLQDKVEKISSQPAYDKRAVESLETIEKSEEVQEEKITKSQILSTMLDLQKSGAGITSHHVARFEGTGEIPDNRVKQLISDALKKA